MMPYQGELPFFRQPFLQGTINGSKESAPMELEGDLCIQNETQALIKFQGEIISNGHALIVGHPGDVPPAGYGRVMFNSIRFTPLDGVLVVNAGTAIINNSPEFLYNSTVVVGDGYGADRLEFTSTNITNSTSKN